MQRLSSNLSGVPALMLALTTLLVLVTPAAARDGTDMRRHALSLIGKPEVGPDFEHFKWVRPDAPKGGQIRLPAIGTFDTLNRFTPRGLPAQGLALVHATLMAPSLDEPSADYGLIAAWVSHPDDFSSATFGLRPEARFHDGKPVTPEDVAFSLDALKGANPRYRLYYKNVVKAEKVGPHEVRFVFDAPGNRELPLIVGSLPILARHHYEAKTADGRARSLADGGLEAPVGAGPYRVVDFEVGRRAVYERVQDWWAADLPVVRGQYNFDRVTYVYYRDRLPAFEGFKAGETDFWAENSAKGWATGFDFDAVRRGLIKREEVPDGNLKHMQGFAFNLRRAKFQDRRVREAFNLAFNFEWANETMFFEQYRRSSSYFGNSELACRGLPEGRERDFLTAVKHDLPAEIFTEPFANPLNNRPEDFRRHLRKAAGLLSAAGFEIKDGVRTNAKGERITVEVLLAQPSFERLVLAYKAELAKLGIIVDVRVVDAAQYRRRLQSFDFDMVVRSFPQSLSPGNEQREFWGSEAASQESSQNIIGIKSPAIDALIERVIYASDRGELVDAARALDRALLWGHYVVPQFHSPNDRIAYWTKLGHPETVPRFSVPSDALIRIWWYDEAAARQLASDRKG